MTYKFEEGKDLIIKAILDRIDQKMTGKQATLFTAFATQFLGTMALSDLMDWTEEDLYGATINFWELMQERKPNETKIRIYNPDYEKDGWQTTHTVIEVLCNEIPFLLDSLRLAIHRKGIADHLVIHTSGLKLKRDPNTNHITSILPPAPLGSKEGVVKGGILNESPIFIEIDRQNESDLDELHQILMRILDDNRIVVEDWEQMRGKVQEAIEELNEVQPTNINANELAETKAFLHWIEDHHFTFLGVRDYELIQKGKETIIQAIPESGLGVLRPDLSKTNVRSISAMTPEARELSVSSRILVMSKTHYLATVHRDAYSDYIGIKRFDKNGTVIGERRIIGLYTSAAYNTNPKQIPFLRHKVALIMEKSGFNPRSHAGKTLLNIIETLPRNDLIQAKEDELLEITMGIFHMQDRRRIRMFCRMDVYGRFISCLVYVPKERVDSELTLAMKKVLQESFDAKEITSNTQFTDTILARIHFIIYINPQENHNFDYKAIEAKLIQTARSWSDELQFQLVDTLGEARGNILFASYKNAFPIAYTDNVSPKTAVYDIKHIEVLSEKEPLGINFYRLMDEPENNYRLKIYHHGSTIALSDILPILENLGLRAISERPYAIKFKKDGVSWINDFAIQYTGEGKFDLDSIRDIFHAAFIQVWLNNVDNDGFNKLILSAGFTWDEVLVLRTYAKYFKQITFIFSQDYIEKALNKNANIAKKLVQLFLIRFEPENIENRQGLFDDLTKEILNDLDQVSNLDEDKIIRQYLEAISSTLRTNYFQSKDKTYFSLKLSSSNIPGVPLPHPKYEIFVYSPRVEGVHLRWSNVARGGIRWSDRREDFRTEVLGLVKAQQVKNAIIVPNGAKGGFVPKWLPVKGSREEIQAEGIACYQLFIRGLMDITDNYIEGVVITPPNVLAYDGNDPYLVVAADKGTATFSDIANAISLEYNFWLGDAFASGGSIGYDHKKMGITAKGAWESVKRHFYEANININKDFTVVGIGDMSGDVFGNGMLLSKHIRLIAAFNHIHIFVDPNPNPDKSFEERQRLFNLPRSTWMDYDSKLISKGGGVFNRSAKFISVTKEMKAAFEIKESTIEPNALISAILKSKVDLIWSGGIGTYIKATSETNAEVGDKTNDGTRVNASELQCTVIGEGGNLGLTQLARIEYAFIGGIETPDFIDNSGGVNCSDHEVNIKILLNGIVASGDLTFKQRNELLAGMTNEVSELVLRDNFLQTRAISLAASQAFRHADLHIRYMNDLESEGKIDRQLESLPDDKAMLERMQIGRGLTRAGLSVLMCYTKILLKENILATEVPEDPYLAEILISYFPLPLQERFSDRMQDHPLKREIIATKLSNIIVNEMGFTFVYRLQDETGASIASIVKAYMISRAVLNLEEIWKQIEEIGDTLTSEKQSDIFMNYIRLTRRITRWFLKNQRVNLDISTAIASFLPGMQELKKVIPKVLTNNNLVQYEEYYNECLQEGIPKKLAHELTCTRAFFSAMDVIDVALQKNLSVKQVALVYFALGEFLDIGWLRTQIIIHPANDHWESLSREALRDDLDWQQRQLTAGILTVESSRDDFRQIMESWSLKHIDLIKRWRLISEELHASPKLTYTMFFVAIRELLDLTQTTLQMIEQG